MNVCIEEPLLGPLAGHLVHIVFGWKHHSFWGTIPVQFPPSPKHWKSAAQDIFNRCSTSAPLQFVSFVSFEQTKVCSQCGQDGVGALNTDRTWTELERDLNPLTSALETFWDSSHPSRTCLILSLRFWRQSFRMCFREPRKTETWPVQSLLWWLPRNTWNTWNTWNASNLKRSFSFFFAPSWGCF